MDNNRYNTKVRKAMSEEYKKCSKTKQDIDRKVAQIESDLYNKEDTLTYAEYKNLESYKDSLSRLYRQKEIELDVWRKAIDICMNLVDEEYEDEE